MTPASLSAGKSVPLEAALSLYESMLRIRLVERKVIELYPTDKIQSPVHLSIGQEAVSAGVARAMRPGDRIYGTYRGHGIYLAKGGDLGAFFAELYGKDAGCARGKGGSMHLVAPEVGLMGCSAVVSSMIPIATGDAYAADLQGRKRAVIAFFGDGALDEGVFYESVNFAVLKNLPILFVCENNEYAIHSKVADRRVQTQLHRIGEGLGLKGRRLDGNDASGVEAAVARSLEKIKAGEPPELLEFMTYRWHEHVGPGIDYAEAYRLPEQDRKAKAKDPLELAKAGLPAEKLAEIEARIGGQIADAVAFAEKAPYPTKDRLLADVYAPR